MRKPTRTQLLRETKRLVGPETMKDIPDDILASVRSRFVTDRSIPYDSLGDKLCSLNNVFRTIDDLK
jgi:hypothetical protein